MPVRMLKPGLRTSEKFNRCSWMAQSAYIRIITMVDDFGRYLANPRLLRSELFPFGDSRGMDIPLPQVETALSELKNAELITLYENDGKSFLQVTQWKERIRAEESKYPPSDAEQQPANSPATDRQVLASPPAPTPTPSPTPNDEGFDYFWKEYPRKVGRFAALKAWRKIKEPKTTLPLILSAIEVHKRSHDWTKDNGQFIPYPATWLNQGRWMDEVAVSAGVITSISPNVAAIQNQKRLDRYEARLKALRELKPFMGWPKSAPEIAEAKMLKEEIEKLKIVMNLKA
jgi:hypothetical protein